MGDVTYPPTVTTTPPPPVVPPDTAMTGSDINVAALGFVMLLVVGVVMVTVARFWSRSK